jgi:hypothetical protein
MKPSSLVGLDGLRRPSGSGVPGRRGLGGGGSCLPSMESIGLREDEDDGGLEMLACRSFSEIRSATVPARRRAACFGRGEAV